MSKQPPPAPTVSAVGHCPTVIKIVGRPGTGSLPSTIAPPDHPLNCRIQMATISYIKVNYLMVYEEILDVHVMLLRLILDHQFTPLMLNLKNTWVV